MKTQKSNIKSQSHNANGKSDLRLRAYKHSLATIKVLSSLPNTKVYWTISDQLLRSTTSIGANIVEARSASSRRDFMHFYEIALKSANETKYWLCLLRDGTDIAGRNIEPLLKETEELANILAASIMTMKKKRQ